MQDSIQNNSKSVSMLLSLLGKVHRNDLAKIKNSYNNPMLVGWLDGFPAWPNCSAGFSQLAGLPAWLATEVVKN